MFRTNIADTITQCRARLPIELHPELQRALACVSFLQTLGASGYNLLHYTSTVKNFPTEEVQNDPTSDVLVMAANIGLPRDFLDIPNFAELLINLWLCQPDHVLNELHMQADLFPGGAQYRKVFGCQKSPQDVLNGYRNRCLMAGVWWQTWIRNNPSRDAKPERDMLLMSSSAEAVKWRYEATQYGAMHLIRNPDFKRGSPQ